MASAVRLSISGIYLVAAIAAGCGKGDDKGGRGEAAGGVPVMGAAELYADYSSLKGADLLNKYSAGVVVSGPVKQTMDLGEVEGFQLWIAVQGPGHIALKFKDDGAAARQKGVKQGDAVKAACQIGGKPEAILFLIDCLLQ